MIVCLYTIFSKLMKIHKHIQSIVLHQLIKVIGGAEDRIVECVPRSITLLASKLWTDFAFTWCLSMIVEKKKPRGNMMLKTCNFFTRKSTKLLFPHIRKSNSRQVQFYFYPFLLCLWNGGGGGGGTYTTETFANVLNSHMVKEMRGVSHFAQLLKQEPQGA